MIFLRPFVDFEILEIFWYILDFCFIYLFFLNIPSTNNHCHPSPRVSTSLYEALNIESQLACADKDKDFLPLSFLYSIVVMNILLVR